MITLKTLPAASRQDVFNQIVEHMLTQNKRCTIEVLSNVGKEGDKEMKYVTMPAYHGDEGTRCAAGCFIAEDEYDKRFEGQAWSWLVCEELVPGEHMDIIQAASTIHDTYPVGEWYEALFRLGTRSKVSVQILERYKP